MKDLPLVYVRWNDAIHPDAGWKHSADDVSDVPAMLCETAGWLVRRNDQCVQIAVTKTHEDGVHHVTGVMVIPVGCILSLTTLALPKTKA